ncbi:hypothetical protein [Amycolatopsis suaedae]|uniref:Lipoprotein n=1 Tax=Amycolatopsis suaedae TaxID=2510978 RepID=A0A4Q7J345_9PSEU|nr:hypothetical protein [Amycolatopsis suaedae]RZQ60743.1 hypothetical protein EWH70_26905 [Amycolatopsis suaedae]
MLLRRLAACAAVALLLAGCGSRLVSGTAVPATAVPTMSSPAATPTAKSRTNAPRSTGQQKTAPAALESMSISLQSNLNYKNIQGLLISVCESGRSGGAEQDLVGMFPALDPSHPEHRIKVHFEPPEMRAAKDEGYYLLFTGGYPTQPGRTIKVGFKAYVDNGDANWCGTVKF